MTITETAEALKCAPWRVCEALERHFPFLGTISHVDACMYETIAEELAPDDVIPKVEAYERLIESYTAMSIATFAKSIGWGRNELFYALRTRGILDSENIPYQKYLEYFVVRHRVVSGINYPTSYLNARGVVYFQKIFR